MRRLTSPRTLGVCALLCATSLPTMVRAQATVPGEVTPPERMTVDENGVNVATGTYRAPRPDLVVGSGPGALADVRVYGQQAWRNAQVNLINEYTATPTVYAGTQDKTYAFPRSGSGFPMAPDGARLIANGGTYQLILADGTRYTYGAIQKASRHMNGREYDYDAIGYASSVSYPSGLTLDLNWLTTSYCAYGGTFVEEGVLNCRLSSTTNAGPAPQIWLTRLTSLSNSAGYRLDYQYAGSSLANGLRAPTAAQIDDWKRLTGSVSGNAQGGGGAMPSVGYAYAITQLGGGAYLSTDDVTDPIGRTWRYTKQYGGTGSYEAVRRPGRANDDLRVDLDAQSRVTAITRDGATWTYAYQTPTASTSSLTVTDPVGRVRRYESDLSVGLPTRVQDEYGRVTSYTYLNNRLNTATSPGGQVTTYSYDDRGNVISTVVTAAGGGAALSSSATYPVGCTNGVTCNLPTSSTDVRGVTTSYGYDPTHGGVTSVVTANPSGVSPSVQTRYAQVNGVWLPQRTWSCRTQSTCDGTADAVQTVTNYNANLLPSSVTSGAGDGSLTATTSATYSAAGDVVTVDGPLPGAEDTARFYYDAARQPLGSIGPDPDGGGPRLRQATRRSYDTWGRVTSIEQGTATDQGNAALAGMAVRQTQSVTLDTAGRTTSLGLSATGTAYARTDFAYDAAGRPTCTAQRMNPAALGSPGNACTVGADAGFGPDRVSLVQYGPGGALSGAWTSATSAYGTPDAATEMVRQTVTGKVLSVSDGNGNTTGYGYDGFDRPTTTTFPGGSYEQVDYAAAASATLKPGDVSGVRLRDGKYVSFGYDGLGRRATTVFVNPVDLTDANLTYSYDLLGGLTLAQDGNGHNVGYTRDALGRVTGESEPYGGTLSSQYDAGGRRTRLTWGDGFFVSYDYDVTGAMTAVRENGGTLLAGYGYDDLGRRVSRNLGNGTSTTYGYDAASRLTALNLNGGGQPNAAGFGYNPAGQITSRTLSNDAYDWTGAVNADRAYTVNGLNQYTASGAVVPTYDGRGNVTSAGGASYHYNGKNQLSGANGTYLYYDATGRLDQVTQSGLGWQWDGSRLVTEWSGGTIRKRYVHGAGEDEPLVWYEGAGTGQRRWLDADERGSIVRVTDDAGTALAVNSYDEYGIPGSGNQGRFQYTGQMWLPELGFYHYKARMYSPTLGRFMQTDPIGYGDGLNMYAYVGGDPVNMTDPSGLAACPPGLRRVYGPQYPSEGMCITDEPDVIVTGRRSDRTAGAFFGYIPSIRMIDLSSLLAAGRSAPAAPQNNNNGSVLQQRGKKMSGKEREEAAEADEKICRVVNTRECWASAAKRDAARVSGRPVPALQTGVRGNWSGRSIMTGVGGVAVLGGVICLLAEPCGAIVGGALTVGGGSVLLTN